MITYERLKEWWKERENRNKVVITISFVLIFLVGYGAGSFKQQIRRENSKSSTNYSTSANNKPLTQTAAAQAQTADNAFVAGTATSSAPAACVIKGNISTGSRKIYHIPGGAFYERTKAEQCFNTEEEAQAAGYVKSSR